MKKVGGRSGGGGRGCCTRGQGPGWHVNPAASGPAGTRGGRKGFQPRGTGRSGSLEPQDMGASPDSGSLPGTSWRQGDSRDLRRRGSRRESTVRVDGGQKGVSTAFTRQRGALLEVTLGKATFEASGMTLGKATFQARDTTLGTAALKARDDPAERSSVVF